MPLEKPTAVDRMTELVESGKPECGLGSTWESKAIHGVSDATRELHERMLSAEERLARLESLLSAREAA